MFLKHEAVDVSFDSKWNETSQIDERVLRANAVSVFVAWQAHQVGSYVFIRLINIATLTLRQCHDTKKSIVPFIVTFSFMLLFACHVVCPRTFPLILRCQSSKLLKAIVIRGYALPISSIIERFIPPIFLGEGNFSRFILYVIRIFNTEKEGSFVKDMKREPINGLPAREETTSGATRRDERAAETAQTKPQTVALHTIDWTHREWKTFL